MEFLVVIHADSPIGAFLLQIKGKVGGATGTMDVQGKTHPFIVATGLDWSATGVLQLMHLTNPGAQDEQPQRTAIPLNAVLVAQEVRTANQPRAEQQQPSSSLH